MGAQTTKDTQPLPNPDRLTLDCPLCENSLHPSPVIRWGFCPICRLLLPPADSRFIPSGAEGLVP